MTALFKADGTFIIKGRGLVLSGWVIEGNLRSGMIVSLQSFPRKLTIDGIEHVYSLPKVDGLIGLLFLSTDQQEIILWKGIDVKGKVLEVIEP